MTILEQAFFILFEEGDDRFVLYLLNQIPNITKYLETQNKDGKLPLFRVLHLFQDELYESERTKKNGQMAEKILAALLQINYNFLHPSSMTMGEISNLSTFELMLLIPIASKYLEIILNHIWQSQSEYIQQMMR